MKTNSTQLLTRSSFFLVMLIISAKISIPIGMIPITLQTFSIFICAYLLTPKHSMLTISVYLLMGLIGLPVFASGGGIGYIMQPSFGFLLSFVIVTPCLSALYHKTDKLSLQILLSFIALFFIYLIGSTYMYLLLNYLMLVEKSVSAVLSLAVFPFIINDSISLIAALFISKRLIKSL